MLAPAVSLNVEAPDPGARKVAGDKLAVRPAGSVAAESATAALNPPLTATLSVTVPLVPCVSDNEGALWLN